MCSFDDFKVKKSFNIPDVVWTCVMTRSRVVIIKAFYHGRFLLCIDWVNKNFKGRVT